MKKITVLALSALSLAACEATKEELGLSRRIPDEFAVVERAPLELPPDFYLRPPTPGAPRPQEQAPEDQAAQALLGTPAPRGTVSKSESVLLQKTNAAQADPTIRQTIDAETKAMAQADKPTIKRILDIGGDSEGPAKIVDPAAEAARIKAAKESGQSVSTGDTPSITK